VPVGGGIAFPHGSGRDCAHHAPSSANAVSNWRLDIAVNSFLNADDIFRT
jgi:hypothetical protein